MIVSLFPARASRGVHPGDNAMERGRAAPHGDGHPGRRRRIRAWKRSAWMTNLGLEFVIQSHNSIGFVA
jgi:hypothetical protein